MVIYNLTPPLSTRFFNFNNFLKNLLLDIFLTNPDSLTSKFIKFLFPDRHHKNTVAGDLRIVKANVLRKLFHYVEVRFK